MDAIFEKIKEMYASDFDGDPEGVELTTRLDELELDSLDTMELLNKIETKFDVDIPDTELDHLTTVGNLVTFVLDNIK